MSIQAQTLIPRLISEFGYPPARANSLAEDLQSCTPRIQAAFKRWWQGEGFDETLEIQGYTLQRFLNEGYTPFGAFLNMDWLIQEPEEALQALAEGYDIIEEEDTE